MFSVSLRPEIVEKLRKEYPKGTRVRLIEMCDPYRDMPAGLEGIVQMVDDAGGIHVNWSNGSSLAALYGIDKIQKID